MKIAHTALLASLLAMASCAERLGYDRLLAAYVGQRYSNVQLPEYTVREGEHAEGGNTIVDLLLARRSHCRWQFVVDLKTGLIAAWRYPDADAREYCHEYPASRP
ncbi:MAG: hypothetical protein ABIR54_09750 [Burkholderiaceae bacterium]